MESVLRKEKSVYGGNDLKKRWVLSWEWKKEGVMDDERWDGTQVVEMTKVEREREESKVEWSWRSEEGSWFQRHGEAYRKEQSVIHREDDVGGRVRVTSDKEWVLQGGWMVMRWCRLWRLGAGEDSVSKWKDLVFSAFSYLEPVKQTKDCSDMADLGASTTAWSREFWIWLTEI